ncbi:MAG: SRPBCC family protein [Pseudomonadota bacterium]
MTTFFLLIGTLAALILALSLWAPRRLSYRESIGVAAPRAQVYDDIRFQERLMAWSAWPAETNSTCALENEDGTEGARTVFFTKGKRTGHQEITSLTENRSVSMTLVGPGPPHKPELTFILEDDGEGTRVHLDFVNTFPRPFNALWHFAGLSKWTRSMHVKDLAGLKSYSERTNAAA